MKSRLRKMFRLTVGLVLVVFLLLFGIKGEGWSLTPEIPLHVEGDRLTGHLSQVTLRTVLEQLQKRLGITYEAPVEELDKVISVDLQQDPILPALAKILAPWDYAFTVNSGGHVQFLYVTAKAPPVKAVSETRDSLDVGSSNPSGEAGFGSGQQLDSEQGESSPPPSVLPYGYEPDVDLSPSASSFSTPPTDSLDFRAPVASAPMDIQPVPAGTTMPMVPASSGGGMQVTPPASSPDMPIIPATSYPPMDIEPVPGYLQEEMLRNMQP